MRHAILAAALLLAATSLGCQSGPSATCNECSPVPGGASGVNAPIEPYGAVTNYLPNGGHGGPLGEHHHKHFRGPQSHLGATPGPAAGPTTPTYGYPYYTTRGPRDYLASEPPSIGL